MEEKIPHIELRSYEINIDDESDNIEIWAEFLERSGPNLCFIRDNRCIAEFKTWRYWKHNGLVTIAGGNIA